MIYNLLKIFFIFPNLGESVVTLLSLQYICTFFGYCSPGRSVAALLYTAFHTIISAFSGFPVYTADIPVSLLVQYTPLAPAYSSLLYKDYSHDVLKNMNSALICRNRHVSKNLFIYFEFTTSSEEGIDIDRLFDFACSLKMSVLRCFESSSRT